MAHGLSVEPITGESMHKIIHFTLFTPGEKGWGLPVILWGEPGESKTSLAEQALRFYGMPCQTLSPGEMGEAAFGVVPVPVGTGKSMRLKMPPPDFFDMFEDAGCGGVFVDEVTGANEAIAPAILALFRERRLGGEYFGTGTRVFGAANPAEIAANGHDLSIPAANRIIHIPWGNVDAADAQRYELARLAKITPECLFPEKDDSTLAAELAAGTKRRVAEEKRVAYAWSAHLSEAIGLVGSFKQRRPEWSHKRPAASTKEATGAWPSTRSWSMAAHAFAGAKLHQLDATESVTVMAGSVGLPAASEFYKFLDECDLPDPAELLTGKVNFRFAGERLDRSFSVLNSCIAYISTTKEKAAQETYAARMWDMLGDVIATGSKEIAASPAKELTKLELYNSQSANKPLLALAKMAAQVRGK